MIIDEATRHDVPQLCELLALLFAEEREFAPDLAKQSAALGLLLGDPRRGRVFVLRNGAELAGMVSVQAVVSTACGGDALLLEDLVVRPRHRGCGHGSALLEHVVRFARASGYRRISLLTDGCNAGARRLYERHGFEASAMTPYRLALDDAGPPG